MKADEIVVSIENAIVSGEFPPGSLLRQEQLARMFSVSRTPIREALRRLEAAGLVSLVANRGARVRGVTVAELREAFLVRAEAEALAAQLAAERIDASALEQLTAADARFAELSDELRGGVAPARLRPLLAEWVAANDAFHDGVLTASGNTLLGDLARACRRVFLPQLLAHWSPRLAELLIENETEHRIVRELLELRSASGARAAMKHHVASSGALMEHALFPTGSPEPADITPVEEVST